MIIRKTINDKEQCIGCDEVRRSSQRLLRVRCSSAFIKGS